MDREAASVEGQGQGQDQSDYRRQKALRIHEAAAPAAAPAAAEAAAQVGGGSSGDDGGERGGSSGDVATPVLVPALVPASASASASASAPTLTSETPVLKDPESFASAAEETLAAGKEMGNAARLQAALISACGQPGAAATTKEQQQIHQRETKQKFTVLVKQQRHADFAAALEALQKAVCGDLTVRIWTWRTWRAEFKTEVPYIPLDICSNLRPANELQVFATTKEYPLIVVALCDYGFRSFQHLDTNIVLKSSTMWRVSTDGTNEPITARAVQSMFVGKEVRSLHLGTMCVIKSCRGLGLHKQLFRAIIEEVVLDDDFMQKATILVSTDYASQVPAYKLLNIAGLFAPVSGTHFYCNDIYTIAQLCGACARRKELDAVVKAIDTSEDAANDFVHNSIVFQIADMRKTQVTDILQQTRNAVITQRNLLSASSSGGA